MNNHVLIEIISEGRKENMISEELNLAATANGILHE